MDKQLYTTNHHHIVMNSEPRHRADAVSYMLKGELCEILDWKADHEAEKSRMNQNFAHIKLLHDGYEGYVLCGHLQQADSTVLNSLHPIFPITREGVFQASKEYMGAPYLRGGRTEYGIDCSGLSQQIYKKFGIQIMRDASQQAMQGIEIPYESIQAGDLVFFEEVIGSGNIKHVGIVVEPGKILHASEQGPANVRINKLTHEGIIDDVGNVANHYVVAKRHTISN